MTASCSWVWASQRRMVLSLGARGQQLAVGAEGHPPDGVGVPAQDGDRARGGDVPETDGPVFPGGGEQAAVGMKSHVDGAASSCPSSWAISCPVATSQSRTGPSADPAASSVPAGLKAARASPSSNRWASAKSRAAFRDATSQSVTPSVSLHRGQSAAVTAVGHRADDPRLVLQQTRLTAGRGVPEACGAVPRRRRHLLAVGAEGDVVDEALVPAQDAVPFQPGSCPRCAPCHRRSRTPGGSRRA